MSTTHEPAVAVRLGKAVVLGVTEDSCTAWSGDGVVTVAFAPQFPAPRLERVAPGHLIAIATARSGQSAIVWRWFDAVVLDGAETGSVRLWEPGHGEVVGQGNEHYQTCLPGSRAYASAGLPGAEWWVAGPVVTDREDAAVELDAVCALFNNNDMWRTVFGV
ncbi:hypothetical protein [Arthrobacter sp. H5]|uniref:hypothetical protein n=1 Tax=Arthrobacter sp. H5 TaxID=1267973 RepID=UPI000481CC5F|nr:hypothetical protein [Arthrobacter sp. H5]